MIYIDYKNKYICKINKFNKTGNNKNDNSLK